MCAKRVGFDETEIFSLKKLDACVFTFQCVRKGPLYMLWHLFYDHAKGFTFRVCDVHVLLFTWFRPQEAEISGILKLNNKLMC